MLFSQITLFLHSQPCAVILVSQFDQNTFVIIDQVEQQKICVCGNLMVGWMQERGRKRFLYC
jgi:hypothetical protein